jgi:hypothetical protein
MAPDGQDEQQRQRRESAAPKRDFKPSRRFQMPGNTPAVDPNSLTTTINTTACVWLKLREEDMCLL